MYGIGSWDGFFLPYSNMFDKCNEKIFVCIHVFDETHKTFPARSYYFIRKVVYKVTFALEVHARGCQPKNDIRILPRASGRKPT